MQKHISIDISGRVQGVGFRSNVLSYAKRYGISGSVYNTTDGKIHIEAEGEEDMLNHFISCCSQGPAKAQVEEITIAEGEVRGDEGFVIT